MGANLLYKARDKVRDTFESRNLYCKKLNRDFLWHKKTGPNDPAAFVKYG